MKTIVEKSFIRVVLRSMTFGRRADASLALLCAGVILLVASPSSASAQGGVSRDSVSRIRLRIAGRGELNPVCAELASHSQALVGLPAGRALLRFRMDLDSAAGAAPAIVLNGQRLDPTLLRQLLEARRGVDSLMLVITGEARRDSGQRRIILRSGGGGLTSTDSLRALNGLLDARIRSLEPKVARIVEFSTSADGINVPAPSGWMGVTISRSSRDVPSPEGILTYYCEYPVIEAVYAGSPAEKGGLRAGDTLIAYNGRDLRAEAVNLTTLLIPKKVVRVGVQREGQRREVSVTVAPRPAELSSVVQERKPLILIDADFASIAGARLTFADEEFAKRNGAGPGVFVLRAPAGTPFADAGVKPGDVIIEANGVALTSLAALEREFGKPGVRSIKLLISTRDSQDRTVTVRW